MYRFDDLCLIFFKIETGRTYAHTTQSILEALYCSYSTYFFFPFMSLLFFFKMSIYIFVLCLLRGYLHRSLLFNILCTKCVLFLFTKHIFHQILIRRYYHNRSLPLKIIIILCMHEKIFHSTPHHLYNLAKSCPCLHIYHSFLSLHKFFRESYNSEGFKYLFMRLYVFISNKHTK